MVPEAQAVSSWMELKERRGTLCRGRTSDAKATRNPDKKAGRVVVSFMKDMTSDVKSLKKERRVSVSQSMGSERPGCSEVCATTAVCKETVSVSKPTPP